MKYSSDVEKGVGLQLVLPERRANYTSFVLLSCFQVL